MNQTDHTLQDTRAGNSVDLADPDKPTTVAVKYIDVNGREQHR